METQIFAPKPSSASEAWDVIIIGSGPAALTAAIYTTRGAASTLVLGGEKWGGQLMLTTIVDNYPGFPEGVQGPDLMAAMRKQAERFGAGFRQENVQDIVVGVSPLEIISKGVKYLARAVIVATGAETRWLEAPGVDRFIGRGISSCAPCDAPFFKSKKVAVVGGGDSAMEEAQVLAKYASKVLLIHRRDEFRASPAMQTAVLRNPNVVVFHCSEVIGVEGEKVVTGLKMKSWKQSKYFDEIKEKIKLNEGTFISEDNEFTYWHLPIDGLFVAIGQVAATSLFTGKIDLDEKGYVVVQEHTKTSAKGVFVAGDVHDYHYRQAITAAGFGCMAAMETLKYLEGIENKFRRIDL